MDTFWGINPDIEPFELFARSHISMIMVLIVVNILIFAFRKYLRQSQANKIIRYTLGISLIVQEALLNVYRVHADTWDVSNSLPLHLCGFSVILCSIMMFSKSTSIYELVYFWGLGGATQAILTPDLTIGYPHFRFFQYFVAHGLIITTVLFMTFVHSYRPTKKSILRVMKVTNLLLIGVAAVNLLTGGNYFFICRKPDAASLLDYLGPWPYYIISLELMALFMFVLLYIPFAIKDRRANVGRRGRTLSA